MSDYKDHKYVLWNNEGNKILDIAPGTATPEPWQRYFKVSFSNFRIMKVG